MMTKFIEAAIDGACRTFLPETDRQKLIMSRDGLCQGKLVQAKKSK